MQWTEDTEDIISHETARTDYCKNVDISSTQSIQLQLSTDKLAK